MPEAFEQWTAAFIRNPSEDDFPFFFSHSLSNFGPAAERCMKRKLYIVHTTHGSGNLLKGRKVSFSKGTVRQIFFLKVTGVLVWISA